MHNNRGRTASRKQLQPRRTHNLGGCSTCRRRHVKCDQTRPQCSVCRKAGLQCGGFPSQIRWASMSTGPPVPKSTQASQSTPSARNPPAPRSTTMSQNTASTQLSQNQFDGNASSNEIQQEDQVLHPSNSPPQSLSPGNRPLIFEDMSSVRVEIPGHAPSCSSAVLPTEDVRLVEEDARFGANETDIFSYPSTSSFSEFGSLLEHSSGLGWNDLFDPTTSFSMPAMHDQTCYDPLGLLAHVASQPHGTNDGSDFFAHSLNSDPFLERQNIGTSMAVPSPQPPPYAPREIDDAEVLEDAKGLLKHFRDVVIPQFAPLPMHSKSPWELLNWNSAVHTLADLTFLQSSTVKHANMANFYAILGCSAHTITKTQSYPDTVSYQKGVQILDYASRQAKSHMQDSLRLETAGSQKAKYKDQLMAIFSLIALATLSGKTADARCYIIDAERLLRLRGLAKREVSRRARLLHHVYTWLRIIGESTFILHDHNSSGLQAKIERIIQNNNAIPSVLPNSDQDASSTSEHVPLDDFLRVETHGADSDSDIDVPKDQEAGLHDIHLSDLRRWPKTLYMEIYGIPEVWLSLVSQTTRVANILEFLDRTSLQAPRAFTTSSQRKTARLEHMICSFSAQHNISGVTSPPDRNNDVLHKPTSASQAMLRAMGSALVIFFYRRVRNVHPFILQSHVGDVITALRDFDLALGADNTKSPGTPWPAFIAGCEALSVSTRECLMEWMQKGASLSASNGFTSSQKIMREVWEQRDAARSIQDPESGISKRGEVYSWVNVLREGKFWLMLY
ncbi:fungal-specific transcription factor domain-containing protein [Paraphoma chrysanthemicola]|uniref:Fungal-specific transcription factor domain-containing protein n=1 Tax=Paraphoma chrysanthemicola TaxID=798071 RepID=A0A8K0R623_9PLEO|nr:fungal-specific transcription factor domain-containing protein [Paraphoma chrysanthemicola]